MFLNVAAFSSITDTSNTPQCCVTADTSLTKCNKLKCQQWILTCDFWFCCIALNYLEDQSVEFVVCRMRPAGVRQRYRGYLLRDCWKKLRTSQLPKTTIRHWMLWSIWQSTWTTDWEWETRPQPLLPFPKPLPQCPASFQRAPELSTPHHTNSGSPPGSVSADEPMQLGCSVSLHRKDSGDCLSAAASTADGRVISSPVVLKCLKPGPLCYIVNHRTWPKTASAAQSTPHLSCFTP